MKRFFLFVAPFFIALLVIGVIVYLLRDSGKGALQVTSIPKSNVFINGKLIGQTPLCRCDPSEMFAVGDYSIKLEPLDTSFPPFEDKIQIGKSVLTVVDRTFGDGSTSEGSIITLTPNSDKKNAQLLIVSFPDNALVFLDSNQVQNTPMLLNNVTESDHEIKLQKEGYRDKTIRIRTVPGYKLTAEVFLGINPDFAAAQQASQSAAATASATLNTTKVTILNTPTGYLNVRSDSSLSSPIIGQVNPGEVYVLISEKDNWFQIQLDKDKSGWISSQYAEKQ